MLSPMYLLLVGCLLVCLQLQPLRAAPGADDPAQPKISSSITIQKLTVEDQKTLAATGRLSIVKVDTTIYVPGPIKYPCGQTWASWWSQNYWYFQCLANMNCRPFRECWCNACACYAFVVNPQYPPCSRWVPWPTDAVSFQADLYA